MIRLPSHLQVLFLIPASGVSQKLFWKAALIVLVPKQRARKRRVFENDQSE